MNRMKFLWDKLLDFFVVKWSFKKHDFFHWPIKKNGFITLILSKFQILKVYLRFIYIKKVEFIVYTFIFWVLKNQIFGTSEALKKTKSAQILDSWPLSMPWGKHFKNIVLYLLPIQPIYHKNGPNGSAVKLVAPKLPNDFNFSIAMGANYSFLLAIVTWYSYMGWFHPVPVGIGLRWKTLIFGCPHFSSIINHFLLPWS